MIAHTIIRLFWFSVLSFTIRYRLQFWVHFVPPSTSQCEQSYQDCSSYDKVILIVCFKWLPLKWLSSNNAQKSVRMIDSAVVFLTCLHTMLFLQKLSHSLQWLFLPHQICTSFSLCGFLQWDLEPCTIFFTWVQQLLVMIHMFV